MIVFDVGANNGSFSKHVLEKSVDSIVYAFEPNKSLFEDHLILLKNDYPKRFFYFNYALGKESKEGKLYGSTALNGQLASTIQFNTKSSKWDNLVKSSNLEKLNIESLEVDIVSVKDALLSLKIKNIDFLKIDTQGTDLEIMEEFLSFAQVESGVVEVDIGANFENQRYLHSNNDINYFNQITQRNSLSVYRITVNNSKSDELNIFIAKSYETFHKNMEALSISESPPFYKFWVVQGIGVNEFDVPTLLILRLAKKIFKALFHPRKSIMSLLVKLTK